MIKLVHIRDLDLNPGLTSRHHVSAASGLVYHESEFFMVADDELHLARFCLDPKVPGCLITIFEGDLPEDHAARKKLKPDLEALTLLPEGITDRSSLLLVPSGSKRNRVRGALYGLPPSPTNKVTEISFAELFRFLENEFPDLNIEGATVLSESLYLFQRGNADPGQNAIIQLNLSRLQQQLLQRNLSPELVTDIARVKLPTKNGIAYGFTDAATDGKDLWFLASAEATENTYDDGEFRGALIGKMDSCGQIIGMHELECEHKPEGLALDQDSFYLVTDADDSKISSSLFKGTLPINRFA